MKILTPIDTAKAQARESGHFVIFIRAQSILRQVLSPSQIAPLLESLLAPAAAFGSCAAEFRIYSVAARVYAELLRALTSQIGTGDAGLLLIGREGEIIQANGIS
ncbi:hypothetical protein [Sphingosinicella sp. BN140058]|uniref:hypothetical protein n=1 Tax=Sphingosinicella sp. BN140058 TaxID=1892855 RepID=UPI0010118B68|nr:hypothetical protein [Sphingosinicella sp. BN140058]QAY80311.1 hypothetical protein ETR14_27085 [Sphingosinicella sp. BN140058]